MFISKSIEGQKLRAKIYYFVEQENFSLSWLSKFTKQSLFVKWSKSVKALNLEQEVNDFGKRCKQDLYIFNIQGKSNIANEKVWNENVLRHPTQRRRLLKAYLYLNFQNFYSTIWPDLSGKQPLNVLFPMQTKYKTTFPLFQLCLIGTYKFSVNCVI